MIDRLLAYLKAHRAAVLLAVLLAVGTVLAGMGLMSTSGYLISRAAERPMLVDLFMVTAAVRFFGISRAVVRYFERVVSHDLTFRILLRIRTGFYRRLNAFPYKWLTARRPGELLTNMVSDIDTLQNVYLRIMAPVMVSLLICGITLGVLLFVDYLVALVVLVFFLLNGWLVPGLALKRARGGGWTDRRARGRMKSFLVDKIQGMHDAVWLEGRDRLLAQQADIQQGIDAVQRKNAATSGMVEGMNQLLAHMALFATLLLSIPLVLGGQLHGTLLAALVLGVFSSFEALQALSAAFVQYDAWKASERSLHSITAGDAIGQVQPETAYRKDASSLQRPGSHPHLAFHRVTFSYGPAQHVLHDLNFELPTGSKTAIVGPTGSGKSTVINLLTGLWQPTSGEITADGCPIGQLDMDQYRSLLAVVSQDTYLFNRPVRDNLLMAGKQAGDELLARALQEVGLNFLSSRLDWVMGSQGMKLSGGERQLFALARAWLKPSRIWLFDELSANLDVATERRILDTLWASLENRTLLMNTHRLVDMERMDQILVMNRGRIIERGRHEQLLQAKGFYARMVQQQMEVIA